MTGKVALLTFDCVNLLGAWLIHPVLILTAKVFIDALPSMTQPYSWTIVNLGYALVRWAASFNLRILCEES